MSGGPRWNGGKHPKPLSSPCHARDPWRQSLRVELAGGARMAGTKQFDTDEALTTAVHRLWSRGYAGTSVSDIVEATGVSRASLYNAFGSKRGLLLATLHHYDRVYRVEPTAELARNRSPRRAVLDLFADACKQDGALSGCLMVNTALELAPHDAEVAAIAAESFESTEQFLRAAIERGQAAGEIDPVLDPALTANTLIGLFLGLRVLARAGIGTAKLQAVAGRAGAAIPSPP